VSIRRACFRLILVAAVTKSSLVVVKWDDESYPGFTSFSLFSAEELIQ
jgi:hypothetical protein